MFANETYTGRGPYGGGRHDRAGATSDDAETLGAGDTFAGLRIDGIAGRGGSGVVYRAWDLQLDQPRALKVLFPDLSRGPRFKERFERESRLIASLDHPSVVTVHRAGEHGRRLFLSMQLVDGETLAELIEREGPLTRERTVSILGQVASALDAARERAWSTATSSPRTSSSRAIAPN